MINTLSKIALGVALAGLASLFIGPWKLVIGGLVVAVASYTWSEYVAPKL